MFVRHLLFLCLVLSACKESRETSQARQPSTSDGGIGGRSAGGDASEQNGTGAGPGDAKADQGDMITPAPDDRDPKRVQEDERLEKVLKARLIECGTISNPQLPVGLERVRDEYGRCFAECFSSTHIACVDVWQAFCGIGGAVEVLSCLDDYCGTAPEDGFLCKGGNRIPHIFLCDQATDCPDGDDEGARCASHTCANGEVLEHVGDIVCDTLKDCADGSDEVGCGYDCKTEPAPECLASGAIRCDGIVSCTDGSDEKDCRDVRCDGGFNFVDKTQVCDGDKDCRDGADEKNCPILPPYRR